MDERYLRQFWEPLERTIKQILCKNFSEHGYVALYHRVYVIVVLNNGHYLYTGLRRILTDHLRNVVLVKVSGSTNDKFLDVLNSCWFDHIEAIVMIRSILMYMDEIYVPQQNVDTVYDLGVKLFHDEIISYGTVGTTLISTLIKRIAAERRGETIDRFTVKNACSMLILYGTVSRPIHSLRFEKEFLEASAEYFCELSQEYLAENNLLQYLNKTERRIEEESARTNFFTDVEMERKILKVIESEMIKKPIERILDAEGSGFYHMLTTDLSRLYKMVMRVEPNLTLLCERISIYLRERGDFLLQKLHEINTFNSEKNSTHIIESLIGLKDQFDYILISSFENHAAIRTKTLDDYEYLLNSNRRAPEFLTILIDDKMKTDGEKLSDNEMDAIQKKLVAVVQLLHDKDIFETSYKKHLAARLLSQQRIPFNAEKAMIVKLRSECGFQFTADVEGMLKDIEISNSLMENFKTLTDNCFDEVDVSVKVLTSCRWPIPVTPQCVLPRTILKIFDSFKSFYFTKHSGRTLNFNPLLGDAEVMAIFYGFAVNADDSSQQESDIAGPSTTSIAREQHKILLVSTIQMCVLLRFNSKSKLNFQETANETNIPERELKQTLMSLSMEDSEQKILCRSSNSQEIENTDDFWVNDNFTSKLKTIDMRIPLPESDVEPERQDSHMQIDENQHHKIDAAIVRIMKSRKQMQHSILISELIDVLKNRFRPSLALVNQRIETLIEREYMKRNEADIQLYEYIA